MQTCSCACRTGYSCLPTVYRTVLQHFTPHYSPWDQRLCFAPDGDFFNAVTSNNVSVVTDHISRINNKGIELKSGSAINTDVIVFATGLNLSFLGKIQVNSWCEWALVQHVVDAW
eukprot:m.751505 g.751505  ORF g.751505 m.751505 type:complete len:115 (-) comp23168_c0_seq4:1905-2249(-)